MKLISLRFACALLCLFVHAVHAQVENYATEFRARHIATAPVIDGLLNDAAWQGAPQVSNFKLIDPVAQGIPSEGTEVWVAYDTEYLYIAARMHEAHPELIVRNTLLQKNNLGTDDRLVVVLDTFYDRQNGYFFEVNANGQRGDALLENNTNFLDDWDGIWQAASAIGADSWTTEIAIPFKTLSFDPRANTWGVNFLRDITHTREWLAWSTIANQEWNIMPRWMGRMNGMSGMEQGVGLDVVPSVSVKRRRNFETGTTDTELEPSLDAFYKITPSLTGALTINTDFSATEVDDRQVNFDRFSLFFPEKRDFFLQDAGIFEFGGLQENGRPFFSRTIGLDENGEIVDINVGAKITGRVNSWNIGALSIRQDKTATLDADSLQVARVKYNYSEGAYVGGIATGGDPQGNNGSSTIGFDTRYQWQNEAIRPLEATAWLQQTHNDNQDNDGNTAWGADIRYPEDKWFTYFTYLQIGENFNPAMGFVNRTGIRDSRYFIRYRNRPEKGPFLATNHWLFVQHLTDFNGNPKTQLVDFGYLELFTRRSDLWWFQYILQREVVDEPFDLLDRLPIPAGDYRLDRWTANMETAPQRNVVFTLNLTGGEFFGGHRRTYNASTTWKPSPHFELFASMELADVELPSGDFLVRLQSLKTTVAFNTKWAWITLAQFDNVSNQLGINSRIRWIPEAGQEYFLVFDHGAVRENGSFRSTQNETVLKLSYTFRF